MCIGAERNSGKTIAWLNGPREKRGRGDGERKVGDKTSTLVDQLRLQKLFFFTISVC